MQKLPLFMTTALLTLATAAVHADLKVIQTTRIDNPQLKAYQETMTQQQRAQMAHSDNPLLQIGPQLTTVYVHGTQSRADIGSTTYLVNTASHLSVVLNRRAHTYTTSAYADPGAAASGQMKSTVKDTGQTKIISGHPARHYTLSLTSASLPGTVVQGDIWAAQDLPQPALLTTGPGPFAAFQSQFRKVKGFPLKTSLVVTGSSIGNLTVESQVTSVSKAPLPASLFSIPAGYKKSSPER